MDPSYIPSISCFTIINVSSLAATTPFESWSIYCAGKAARDIYHAVLAKEQLKFPDRRKLVTLNYAPGPLDTNMQKEIRENEQVDKETREFFKTMKDNNQLVDPNVSADKLSRLIISGSFESGSHVDFYELPN
jgi:sepiapterin reductase